MSARLPQKHLEDTPALRWCRPQTPRSAARAPVPGASASASPVGVLGLVQVRPVVGCQSDAG